MSFYTKVERGMKRIWKRSKKAIITSIAVAGTMLMVTAFLEILPPAIKGFYSFIVGLGLVILAGYISSRGKR